MEQWGVIFDWDGVIVDTANLHNQAWQQLAAEIGRTIPPDFFQRSFGMKNETAIRELLGWADNPIQLQKLSQMKEEHFRRLVHKCCILSVPGSLELVRSLKTAGIPYAVGSSTPLENIKCVTERLGISDLFPILVTAEDVSKGKPDPEVFLKAAYKLNIIPTKCIVIEDAPVGIEAAKRAGMKAVAITQTHPPQDLTGADLVVESLYQLNIDHLRRLVDAS